jgi:hypothetical protein
MAATLGGREGWSLEFRIFLSHAAVREGLVNSASIIQIGGLMEADFNCRVVPKVPDS